MILLYTKRKNPHEDPAKGIPENDMKNIEMPRKVTFNLDIQSKILPENSKAENKANTWSSLHEEANRLEKRYEEWLDKLHKPG